MRREPSVTSPCGAPTGWIDKKDVGHILLPPTLFPPLPSLDAHRPRRPRRCSQCPPSSQLSKVRPPHPFFEGRNLTPISTPNVGQISSANTKIPVSPTLTLTNSQNHPHRFIRVPRHSPRSRSPHYLPQNTPPNPSLLPKPARKET